MALDEDGSSTIAVGGFTTSTDEFEEPPKEESKGSNEEYGIDDDLDDSDSESSIAESSDSSSESESDDPATAVTLGWRQSSRSRGGSKVSYAEVNENGKKIKKKWRTKKKLTKADRRRIEQRKSLPKKQQILIPPPGAKIPLAIERILGRREYHPDSSPSSTRHAMTSSPTHSHSPRKHFGSVPREQYLVKWKKRSYIHATWEDVDYIEPEKLLEWKDFTPAASESSSAVGKTSDESRHRRRLYFGSNEPKGRWFLVKWHGLQHEECTFKTALNIWKTHQSVIQYKKAPPRPSATSFVKMNESPVYSTRNGVGGKKIQLKLRDYQLTGVNWLLFNWYNHLFLKYFSQDMGLGKTIQTIAFLRALSSGRDSQVRGPFLIVGPLSCINQWYREVSEWWSEANIIFYHGNAASRRKTGVNTPEYNFQVVVTTYEMCTMDSTFLRRVPWQCVVVDEAHRLKNPNSKLALELSQYHREHVVLLTGTPLQNNMSELWALLHFTDASKFPMLRPFLLRRLKENVEKNLPPKEETIVEVPLMPLQKQYYRATAANGPSLMNVVMELRKCCNHPYLIRGAEEWLSSGIDLNDSKAIFNRLVEVSGKVVLLDKLLPKLKAGGHKVLIFSQMVRMLNILADWTKHKGFDTERIDGSIRGSGVGINLTAADTVIIFDSDWNPQNDIQAMARAHRIGQTKPVKIYRLLTAKTFEVEMFERASMKLGLDQAVLTNVNDGTKSSGVDGLLKRGAYSVFQDSGDHAESKEFCADDIDGILARSSYIKKEDKETQEKRTGDVDIDDPDFWSKTADEFAIDNKNRPLMKRIRSVIESEANKSIPVSNENPDKMDIDSPNEAVPSSEKPSKVAVDISELQWMPETKVTRAVASLHRQEMMWHLQQIVRRAVLNQISDLQSGSDVLEEAIRGISDGVLDATKLCRDLQKLACPRSSKGYKQPAFWWGNEEDGALLLGVFLHGWGKHTEIRKNKLFSLRRKYEELRSATSVFGNDEPKISEEELLARKIAEHEVAIKKQREVEEAEWESIETARVASLHERFSTGLASVVMFKGKPVRVRCKLNNKKLNVDPVQLFTKRSVPPHGWQWKRDSLKKIVVSKTVPWPSDETLNKYTCWLLTRTKHISGNSRGQARRARSEKRQLDHLRNLAIQKAINESSWGRSETTALIRILCRVGAPPDLGKANKHAAKEMENDATSNVVNVPDNNEVLKAPSFSWKAIVEEAQISGKTHTDASRYFYDELFPHAVSVIEANVPLNPQGSSTIMPQLSPTDYSERGVRIAKKFVERIRILRALRKLCGMTSDKGVGNCDDLKKILLYDANIEDVPVWWVPKIHDFAMWVQLANHGFEKSAGKGKRAEVVDIYKLQMDSASPFFTPTLAAHVKQEFEKVNGKDFFIKGSPNLTPEAIDENIANWFFKVATEMPSPKESMKRLRRHVGVDLVLLDGKEVPTLKTLGGGGGGSFCKLWRKLSGTTAKQRRKGEKRQRKSVKACISWIITQIENAEKTKLKEARAAQRAADRAAKRDEKIARLVKDKLDSMIRKLEGEEQAAQRKIVAQQKIVSSVLYSIILRVEKLERADKRAKDREFLRNAKAHEREKINLINAQIRAHRSMMNKKRKKKGPRGKVSLHGLITAGLLVPGTGVFYIDYRDKQFRASLAEDGTLIDDETGEKFLTPSGWSIKAKRRLMPSKQADDGWKSVKYEGSALELVKKDYLINILGPMNGIPPPPPEESVCVEDEERLSELLNLKETLEAEAIANKGKPRPLPANPKMTITFSKRPSGGWTAVPFKSGNKKRPRNDSLGGSANKKSKTGNGISKSHSNNTFVSGLGRKKRKPSGSAEKKKKKKKKKRKKASDAKIDHSIAVQHNLALWKKWNSQLRRSSKYGSTTDVMNMLEKLKNSKVASLSVLSEVGIGKTVGKLARKHADESIRQTSELLVKRWREAAQAETNGITGGI
eukprot:GSMAST32.ASY1.ANO1.1348.1 assembled CDS